MLSFFISTRVTPPAAFWLSTGLWAGFIGVVPATAL